MYRVVGSIKTSTRCVSRRPSARNLGEKRPSQIWKVWFRLLMSMDSEQIATDRHLGLIAPIGTKPPLGRNANFGNVAILFIRLGSCYFVLDLSRQAVDPRINKTPCENEAPCMNHPPRRATFDQNGRTLNEWPRIPANFQERGRWTNPKLQQFGKALVPDARDGGGFNPYHSNSQPGL